MSAGMLQHLWDLLLHTKEKPVARVSRKAHTTYSLYDLSEEEYAAVLEGLRAIKAVGDLAAEEEDEEPEHYGTAKRLLVHLGEGSPPEHVFGGGLPAPPAPQLSGGSDEDPRGGLHDPLATMNTGGTFIKRPRE